MRPFLGGAALFRFLGDAFFVGDIGSGGIVDSSGSKICVGSTFSAVLVLRDLAAVRGVGGASVVFLRVWRLGLRCGAGVKSSPSSSRSLISCAFSSSESSTTKFLRATARREGLVGEIVAIAAAEGLESEVAVVFVYHLTYPHGDSPEIGSGSLFYNEILCLDCSLMSVAIMDDFDDFESVFGSNPNIAYDEETRRKVLQHRRSLDNELFIDRLLKALGVSKGRDHRVTNVA